MSCNDVLGLDGVERFTDDCLRRKEAQAPIEAGGHEPFVEPQGKVRHLRKSAVTAPRRHRDHQTRNRSRRGGLSPGVVNVRHSSPGLESRTVDMVPYHRRSNGRHTCRAGALNERVDGEGCLRSVRHHGRPRLRLQVSQLRTWDTMASRCSPLSGPFGRLGFQIVSVRIVFAEDHHLAREGVRRLLEAQPELDVVGVCADLDALIAALDAHRPDVLVTDIRMPPTGTDEGIRAADHLRTVRPDAGVVLLSQYADPQFALAFFEHGSRGRGYLLKERVWEVDQLVAAVQEVARGGSVVDPDVIDALIEARSRSARSPLRHLTTRDA